MISISRALNSCRFVIFYGSSLKSKTFKKEISICNTLSIFMTMQANLHLKQFKNLNQFLWKRLRNSGSVKLSETNNLWISLALKQKRCPAARSIRQVNLVNCHGGAKRDLNFFVSRRKIKYFKNKTNIRVENTWCINFIFF